jgi:hypothetical protein
MNEDIKENDTLNILSHEKIQKVFADYDVICVLNNLKENQVYIGNCDKYIEQFDKSHIYVSCHYDFYLKSFYSSENGMDGKIFIFNNDLLKKTQFEIQEYNDYNDRFLLYLKNNKKVNIGDGDDVKYLMYPIELDKLKELHVLY